MGVTDEASSDTLGKRKQQMEKFSTEKKKNCVFAWNVWKNRKERERERKRNKVISLDAKPLQGLSDTINAHLSA